MAATAYEFVNAGINGNLAWNVLQRLDGIVACRPDAVTLLVGTNDVLGTLGPSWETTYRRQQHIRRTPTLAWYRESVGAILDRLRAETDARVAVLDLPPLGEDLDSETNGRVRAYNAALLEVAAAAGVPVLPLHERLVALLPAGHRPPPFAGRRDLMGSSLFRRLVLRAILGPDRRRARPGPAHGRRPPGRPRRGGRRGPDRGLAGSRPEAAARDRSASAAGSSMDHEP